MTTVTFDDQADLPQVADETLTFEEFFQATARRTVAAVAVVTGDRSAAEDAAQEAYVRALLRWDTVRATARPDKWVAQVAIRIAIDSWRRHRKEAELSAALAVPRDDHVERLWITWGLDKLSPKQRAAIVMKYMDGHGLEGIAAAEGSSRETVKTHLDRGRRRLRTLLGGDS